MSRPTEACPNPSDFEPMCFQVDPLRALDHARGVCRQLGLPDQAINVALGVVVPSLENPEKILYGLRSPQYHTEYKDTWGLPSIGLSIDEFLKSGADNNVLDGILTRICERKLPGVQLQFDRTIAWTGRVRLHQRDHQFLNDYYLIMVDVKAKQISQKGFPAASAAYTEFQWLTPDEHTALIMQAPNHACGACSDLASLAFRLGKL